MSSVAITQDKSTSRPRITPPSLALIPHFGGPVLRWFRVTTVLVVVMMSAGAWAVETPVTLDATVGVSADLGTVGGHVDVTILNVTNGGLDVIPLWTFPGRLATPPKGMSEVEVSTMFPRGFRPARMEILSVRRDETMELTVKRRSATLTDVLLDRPLAPGTATTLRVRFKTHVPARFGPFGRVDDQLLLDGGAFPRPPPFGAEGFRPDEPPDDIEWSLSVLWEGGDPASLLVNGRFRPLAPNVETERLRGVDQRISLSVLMGANLSEFEHAGVRIRYVHRRTRCHRAAGDELVDLGCVDVQGQVLASVAHSMAWLMRQGVTWPSGELLLLESPLRRDVALAAPGMVLVSDRAFELLPIEKAYKFHRIALSRALYGLVLRNRLTVTEPGRRDQVTDMVAVAMAQGWESEQYGKRESGADVLKKGSFMAAIDDTIAAPQVPFVSTYFVDVDDTDRYRDRFVLFSHQRPNGRLWLAKLRDRIGHSDTARVVAHMLGQRGSLEDALKRWAPQTSLAYLKRWNDGVPPLNYRLGKVGTGHDAKGAFVDVEVLREGAVGAYSELVTVRVAEAGVHADQMVEVDSPRHVVRIRPPNAMSDPRVEIDPAGRLVETSLDGGQSHQRDNRNFSRWRFLVNGLYGSINSASGYLALGLVTSLKASHEPQHHVLMTAGNYERSLGAGTSYLYGFGRLIRPNLHQFHFGVGVGGAWLKPYEEEPDGAAFRLSVSLSDYTFVSRTDPRNGVGLALRGGPSVVRQAGEVKVAAFADSQITGVVEASPRHVLAGHLQLSSLFGELPATQRWPVGGLGAVRGFATYAATGRHRALVRAEWRHQFTRDLSWNLMRLFWVRGVDGVAFVDAALLGDSAQDFADWKSLYLAAGYGCRFHYLVGGVFPMVFLLDVGFPIVDQGRPGVRSGPPVSLVLGVSQAF